MARFFRTRSLNEWVGRIFGFVLFYPRTFDQVQHMAHHRYTQDWARDGELARDPYTLRSYPLVDERCELLVHPLAGASCDSRGVSSPSPISRNTGARN